MEEIFTLTIASILLLNRPTWSEAQVIRTDYTTQSTKHITSIAVPLAEFQGKITELSGKQYKPVWVDAYTVKDIPYFNTVWQTHTNNFDWKFFFGQTVEALEKTFITLKALDYHLVQIDSYMQGSYLLYTTLYYHEKSKDWVAYYGVNIQEHIKRRQQYSGDGYRLTVQSILVNAGNTYVAAVYEKSGNLTFSADYNLHAADFNKTYTIRPSNESVTYLNAYRDQSQSTAGVLLSAIFTQGGPQIQHYVVDVPYLYIDAQVANKSVTNKVILSVTGYPDVNETRHLFAAIWVNESDMPVPSNTTQIPSASGAICHTGTLARLLVIFTSLSLYL